MSRYHQIYPPQHKPKYATSFLKIRPVYSTSPLASPGNIFNQNMPVLGACELPDTVQKTWLPCDPLPRAYTHPHPSFSVFLGIALHSDTSTMCPCALSTVWKPQSFITVRLSSLPKSTAKEKSTCAIRITCSPATSSISLSAFYTSSKAVIVAPRTYLLPLTCMV